MQMLRVCVYLPFQIWVCSRCNPSSSHQTPLLPSPSAVQSATPALPVMCSSQCTKVKKSYTTALQWCITSSDNVISLIMWCFLLSNKQLNIIILIQTDRQTEKHLNSLNLTQQLIINYEVQQTWQCTMSTDTEGFKPCNTRALLSNVQMSKPLPFIFASFVVENC